MCGPGGHGQEAFQPRGVRAGGQLQSPNLKATHHMTHVLGTQPESSVRRQLGHAAGATGPV